ncbi:hypothetical protein F4860DRAFT_120142 [Xylaria cubensis]|nr:hypothetical protein F4860DRAFT_120142 [Xylaria cubensis]
MASALGLLGLPVEMNVEVLSFALLNSSEDVLNLAISCKAMYGIFKNHKTSILLAILSQIDPKELAIATAHYHATILLRRWKKDLRAPVPQDPNDYLSRVTDFCEQHLGKQGTELRIQLQDFTLPMVAHIQDIHLIICRLATKLAPGVIYPTSRRPAPSSVEMAKISKALYIIDLVQLLLLKALVASNRHAGFDTSQRDQAFTEFWLCFAPWEGEQVAIMAGRVYELVQHSRSTHRWFYGDAGVDLMRYIVWRGMKGVDRIIRDGLSKHDKRLHKFIMKAPRFEIIADMPSAYLAFWSQRPSWPRQPITVDPKIFERYEADVDESARVWLCRCANLSISGQPQEYGVLWDHFFEFNFVEDWSNLFWDLDHLLAEGEGRLPTLTRLVRLLANENTNVDV